MTKAAQTVKDFKAWDVVTWGPEDNPSRGVVTSVGTKYVQVRTTPRYRSLCVVLRFLPTELTNLGPK